MSPGIIKTVAKETLQTMRNIVDTFKSIQPSLWDMDTHDRCTEIIKKANLVDKVSNEECRQCLGLHLAEVKEVCKNQPITGRHIVDTATNVIKNLLWSLSPKKRRDTVDTTPQEQFLKDIEESARKQLAALAQHSLVTKKYFMLREGWRMYTAAYWYTTYEGMFNMVDKRGKFRKDSLLGRLYSKLNTQERDATKKTNNPSLIKNKTKGKTETSPT
eukprot:GHVO01041998.1.p1 GENE.GHVO01041998.1~~GHVO01041998.1.p1  ORF type:complete len:216 (+),score=14.37 GHVO01041998.1:206-853(+)